MIKLNNLLLYKVNKMNDSIEMANFSIQKLFAQNFTEEDFAFLYPCQYRFLKKSYEKNSDKTIWSIKTRSFLRNDFESLKKKDNDFLLLMAIKKRDYCKLEECEITPSTLWNKDHFGVTFLQNIAFINDKELQDYIYKKIKDSQEFSDNKPLKEADGCTLWHFAVALNQNEEILKQLPLLGINRKNNRGKTPLHVAVMCEAINSLDALLHFNNIGLNDCDDNGNTAVHLAIKAFNINILKRLIAEKDKLNINIENNAGATPLHLAVKRDEALKILLSHSKINLHAQNGLAWKEFYGTPFHVAAEKNLSNAMQMLLERDRTILNEERLGDGYSALHCAAANGNAEAIALLLSYGADMKQIAIGYAYNYAWLDGAYTALHLAVLHKHYGAVLPFLQQNIALCLKIQTKLGFTPLDYAAQLENEAIIQVLLSALSVQSALIAEDKYELCLKALKNVQYRQVAYKVAHWLIKFYIEMLNDEFDKVRRPTIFGCNKINKIRAALELQTELEKDIPEFENLLTNSNYKKEFGQGRLGQVFFYLKNTNFIEAESIKQYKNDLLLASFSEKRKLLYELLNKLEQQKLPIHEKFNLLFGCLFDVNDKPNIKKIIKLLIPLYINIRESESVKETGVPKNIKLAAARALKDELDKQRPNLEELLQKKDYEPAFINGRLGCIVAELKQAYSDTNETNLSLIDFYTKNFYGNS